MSDDLGLDALARIQAIDARDAVHGFRDDWLGGRTLGDEDEAVGWMREQLGATSNDATFHVQIEGIEVSAERWGARGNRWNSFDVQGEHLSTFETPNDSAMAALGVLTHDLAAAFGREWMSRAPLFLLTDAIPALKPAEFLAVSSLQRGGLRNASGPLSEQVILFVRPQATTADVAAAYRCALERLHKEAQYAPRKRIRPMSSPRMRDLAVLGARIAVGEFESWAEALAVYEAEHAEGSASPDVTYRKEGSKGRFRRDVRMAYERVTGLDLDFRPDQRGTPPVAHLHLRNGTEPPKTVWTGPRAEKRPAPQTEEEHRAELDRIREIKKRLGKRAPEEGDG